MTCITQTHPLVLGQKHIEGLIQTMLADELDEETIGAGNYVRVPIVAAAAGVVTSVLDHASYGNYIVILHDNGLRTLYAHNHRNIVTSGRIEQGKPIAIMGNTGNSDGPHLHFELRPTNDDQFRVNALAMYERRDHRKIAGEPNPNPLFKCIAPACRNGCIEGGPSWDRQVGGGLNSVVGYDGATRFRGGHNFVYNPSFDPTFFNGGFTNGNNRRWWQTTQNSWLY